MKVRSHQSRGVTVGTRVMDEALYFLRIGSLLGRADNTARPLDVKFAALASEYFRTGNFKESQEVDFYRSSAILRSVSGSPREPDFLDKRSPASSSSGPERHADSA